MNNIKLHIEQLVLHGFRPSDRHRIGKAVEFELTRLFTEQGISHSMNKGGDFTHLDGGTFNMSSNSRAEVIGTQVAESVYKGLNKSRQLSAKT